MKHNSSKRIWITWHYAARSRNLAKELNLELHEFQIVFNKLVRHTISPLWTVWILAKSRPKVVYLQYSFLLLLIVDFYKLLFSNKIMIVADCHTKALRRCVNGFLAGPFWKLKKFSFKHIDLAIVSNKGMIKDIEKLNCAYMILPDKIPGHISVNKSPKPYTYCVYVSSFAVDEPFEEIFEVAQLLGPNIKLFWTGKIPHHHISGINIPENINFTGYLSFEDYYNLIGNADAVLALTTESDCLQSGAYEALGIGIPMVVSDTEALRAYFGNAALYTSHNPDMIAKSIKEIINNNSEYLKEIKRIRTLRNNEFELIINELKKIEQNSKITQQ